LLEKISENSDLKTEALLNEITDAEKRVVQAVLERIYEDPSGVLAFDSLFGEKFRLVIPFPVKDKESQLGEWVHTLEQVLEVDVDWEKGMVSAEREWDNHHTALDDTANQIFGDDPPPKKLKRKFQMKIGKYFAKLDDLMKQYIAMRQKIGDHKFKDRPAKGPGAVGGKHLLKYTIGDTHDALSEEELKRYHQIMNQLELYAGNTSHGRMLSFLMDYTEQDLWRQKEQHRRDMQDEGDRQHGKKVRDRKPIVVPDSKFVDMGTYWLNNSKKIREEVPTLENDKYSIIISRHPIDVLRMSDFEKIYSCHSPPSRAGGTGEYYKCAGAEAQGHGAIAFVVDTDDLLSATNTGNLESAEQELMEWDEIFKDQKREFGVGENLELEDPLGRTRLRQLRFFPDLDVDETQIEVAVPEKATYGEPPVGLVDRVVRWARTEQEAVISAMPRRTNGQIDLDDFRMYGGSYEDTQGYGGRKELLAILTGLNMDDFFGQVEQVTDTEDELEDWGGIDAATVQREVDDTAAKWNRDWSEVNVKGVARDTGDEEEAILIGLDAVINFEWGMSEWTRLPNYEHMVECIGELLDLGMYGSIPNLDEKQRVELAKTQGNYNRWDSRFNVTYSNSYLSLESYIGKMHTEGGGEVIRAIVRIDPTKLIGWGHEQALHNYGEEYSFERFCQVLNLIDGRVSDAIREGIENYFKKKHFMEGGSYVNLVTRIEQDGLGSYEWDVDYDKEPPDESYETWASVSFDFDPEELGVEPRILFDLVDRREFALRLRGFLTSGAREETGGEYWLSIRDKSAVDSGGDVRYSITFHVTADTPDEAVEQFYELVTGDMDDEDEISKAFMSALAEEAQKNGVKLNLEGYRLQEPPKQRDFDALQDLGESKRYDANYLVKTWKRFIL
jgi:hypothetical protein